MIEVLFYDLMHGLLFCLFVNSCCQISFSIKWEKTHQFVEVFSFSLSIYILGLYILAETTISQLELNLVATNMPYMRQHDMYLIHLIRSKSDSHTLTLYLQDTKERESDIWLAKKPWNYPLRWWDLNWHVNLLSRKGSFRVAVISAIFVGANLDCCLLDFRDKCRTEWALILPLQLNWA